MKFSSVALGAMFCGSLLLAASARADQISNPNFFAPPGTEAETHENPGTYLVGTSGWQALGTTTNFAGASTYSQFGAGYAGAQYYGELNNFDSSAGTGEGGWQQVINTIAGQPYQLSFAYNYLSPGDTIPTSFTASAYDGNEAYNATAGTVLNSGTYIVPDRGFGVQQSWFTTSFTFIADSSLTTIRFASDEQHVAAFGPTIDGVSVIQLPEPSSLMALCGFGLAGLVLLAGRRIRKAA